MRKSCLDCTSKHLAQAIILMTEAQMGYPIHKWLAIGHMAEAEAESLYLFPELAIMIRERRKAYEMNETVLIMDLLEVANEMRSSPLHGTRGEE